jgi:hypothetical protein
MTKQWPELVRTSGKLLVWTNQAAKAGWSVPLDRAIQEFNRAAHARGLALRFELTTKEKDAQVTFGIGTATQFVAATHGITSLSSIEHSGEIVKADILVHPKPQVQASRKLEIHVDAIDKNYLSPAFFRPDPGRKCAARPLDLATKHELCSGVV